MFATAVRAASGELATRQGKEPSVDDIVRRLRGSRARGAPAEGAGRVAGRAWAGSEAEWFQHKELAAAFGKWSDADWRGWNPAAQCRYRDFDRGGLPFFSPATVGPIALHVLRVVGEIVPPAGADAVDLDDLWPAALNWWWEHGVGEGEGDGEPATEYVQDFLAGALEVYEQVREQVEEDE